MALVTPTYTPYEDPILKAVRNGASLLQTQAMEFAIDAGMTIESHRTWVTLTGLNVEPQVQSVLLLAGFKLSAAVRVNERWVTGGMSSTDVRFDYDIQQSWVLGLEG